jgi:hypothetical protein
MPSAAPRAGLDFVDAIFLRKAFVDLPQPETFHQPFPSHLSAAIIASDFVTSIQSEDRSTNE